MEMIIVIDSNGNEGFQLGPLALSSLQNIFGVLTVVAHSNT